MVLRRLRDPRRIRHAGPARKKPGCTPRIPIAQRSPCGRGCRADAVREAGEGFWLPREFERTPHPARLRFALPRHPLPQGERGSASGVRLPVIRKACLMAMEMTAPLKTIEGRDIAEAMREIGVRAKAAARTLALAPSVQKDAALAAMA